jgi:hypothetical protein
MNTPRKLKPISHEDLQSAIRKFKQNGGIIKKLPDQPLAAVHIVGVKRGYMEAIPEGAA